MHWVHLAAVVALGIVLSAGAQGAPAALIDATFGREGVAVAAEGARETGVLPPGWRANSSWAPVSVHYSEEFEETRPYTRINVTQIDGGRCQTAFDVPDLESESFFRLTVEMRSPEQLNVQFGIRQQGTPYEFLWQATQGTTADWHTYEFEFRAGPSRQPIGFWMNLDSVGRFDVSHLKLERLSPEDLKAELAAKYPEGGPRNLVRNSRFPLGLQSGWSLGREHSDGDDVVIRSDPGVPGPSGSPTLRISSAEPMTLHTAPFPVPLALDTHTASLFVLGQTELRITVLCDGRWKTARTFSVDSPDAWLRVSMQFKPELLGKLYGLRLEGQGTFWIDALQVAAGEEREYAPQLDAEVALALPDSDASMARVQFDDEPAELLWAVTGEAPGAVLKLKVVNVYGEEVALPDTPIGPDFLTEGLLDWHVFPERPYGPFRIEAWVERDGERVSTFGELVVYRLRRPRHWGEDAPDSPFGVHTLSTTRHNLMAKAVGINWTRLHDAGLEYAGWYHLEEQPGEWTFYDKEILRYRRDHIKVLGCLSTAPKWASYYPGYDVNGYFDRFYQPKDMDQYANYVRTVVERYKDDIDAWDIWNEPWIHSWWGIAHDREIGGRSGYVTSEEPAADFARMMQVAYGNAKAVKPDVTILGVNSTDSGGWDEHSMKGTDWTRGIVEAGGMEWCDVICYHNYADGVLAYPGDGPERGFGSATGAIAETQAGIDRPVWMTEGSAARELMGNGMYDHTVAGAGQPPGENLGSADRLCRYVVSVLAAGCEKVFLYSMHSHGYFGGSQWRTIVSPEGYLHPSAAGHAAMAWELEDTRFVQRITAAEDVHAYLFEARDGSRSVAVLAPRPGVDGFVVPEAEGVTVRDLMGNAVAADKPIGDKLTYVSAAGKVDALARLLTP